MLTKVLLPVLFFKTGYMRYSTTKKSLHIDHQVSDEGRVPLDLLPDDVNAIMAQSTTPICPICNKDCTNFPNLRSHLQVRLSR